jgi:SPP1 gp7 family putative phage head morphogenesis protein
VIAQQVQLIRRLFGNRPQNTARLAQDRDFRSDRYAWAKSRRAETHYAVQLRKLCRQIEALINGTYEPDQPTNMIEFMLLAYADLITPWAEATAARMLADVDRRDRAQWMRHSRLMSKSIREEIAEAPTGEILRRLQQEQVTLIKSLPLQAAERVHRIAVEGITAGTRGEDIYADIMRTGQVTESRARLIARTETSRAASNLTQARAEYIGSKSYIWRTVGDVDVRHDHRVLNGKRFDWNDPPIADKRGGVRAHPGTLYNCRCVAEPVLPDEF